jgi:Uma2 family endonuclease
MAMPTMRRVWTVDDLLDLPDDDGNRYEVLDGELLVTPAPSWAHQRIVLALAQILAEYLGRQRVGDVLFAPADVTFSTRRGLQPDLFVTPLMPDAKRPARFSDVGRLLLAIEVLSPSTARVDRVEKRRTYREEGVPEYWLVDPDARTIERSTPYDDRIDIYDATIDWLPDGATEPLTIDLEQLFRDALD